MKQQATGIDTEFSAQERAKNLERGAVWSSFGFKPYMGDFKEIDLTGELWFCPQCRRIDRQLKLSPMGDSLYCIEHPEICEYAYSNQAGRDKRKTFLSQGYEWPMSLMDIKRHKLACSKARLVRINETLESLAEELFVVTKECVDLEMELAMSS